MKTQAVVGGHKKDVSGDCNATTVQTYLISSHTRAVARRKISFPSNSTHQASNSSSEELLLHFIYHKVTFLFIFACLLLLLLPLLFSPLAFPPPFPYVEWNERDSVNSTALRD